MKSAVINGKLRVFVVYDQTLVLRGVWSFLSDQRYFFFQAEDGIRDTSVTGVQTCALPISRRFQVAAGNPIAGQLGLQAQVVPPAHPNVLTIDASSFLKVLESTLGLAKYEVIEIGRASCRERG